MDKNHVLRRIWKDCKGQDVIEYALAVGIVAVAAVAAMPPLMDAVSNVFSRISSLIEANVR